MTVIDASVVIDLLDPQEPGRAARARVVLEDLRGTRDTWLAPDILVFEVFSGLRRRTLRKEVAPAAASRAFERLGRLPIELFATLTLTRRAWELRDRFSAGDALYAALALTAQTPLMTFDKRMADAAQAAGIEVLQA